MATASQRLRSVAAPTGLHRVDHLAVIRLTAHPLRERPVSKLLRSCAAHRYLSIRYRERLAEAGIEPSVGSKGETYDNALAATIDGL